MEKIISQVAAELNFSEWQIEAVNSLLEEGATVPFIARYRKEKTGSLEDYQIVSVKERINQLRELEERRRTILKSMTELGKLTNELERAILEAGTMSQLEDIYLPFKPKRKTKATVAKERGLEPLADWLLLQKSMDVANEASKYINEEKEVTSIEVALQGARDILAERMSEDLEIRQSIRQLFEKEAVITSKVMKGKEKEAAKYTDYFDWSEPIRSIPSHRLLAIRRGERELLLSVDIAPDETLAIEKINRKYLTAHNEASNLVAIALKDGYKRLLKPSLETEIRMETKRKADQEAIRVFAENLKQLLLAAPLGQKRILALDPGFRTGCKLVCLNEQGKLLETTAIFPHEPQRDTQKAAAVLLALAEKHRIDAIVIGNGTASRETEEFVKSIGLPNSIIVATVSESGASVYSASEVAREEFPNHDVTVRGAVSIGRRILDPLAELVKIDPKSIGVGQYQHDVDQNLLKMTLDDVVVHCVNRVGVELNTASKQLLTYVSGLGPVLAENIVKYREEHGPFFSRESLKKVPRLGEKAFEQAAGFLRISQATNPLDKSAVHPERYTLVQKMADDLQSTVEQVMTQKNLRDKINIKKYVSDQVGLPTLEDIMSELEKPGRDPREKFEVFSFMQGIQSMQDLYVGMKLPGIVTNITKFGAFVDIGVHQDGLVHISHLSDRFVADPTAVIKLQQKVNVTVMEVDVPRKRIALSMKSDPFGHNQTTTLQDKRQIKETEGDLQFKLAQLKGKFNK